MVRSSWPFVPESLLDVIDNGLTETVLVIILLTILFTKGRSICSMHRVDSFDEVKEVINLNRLSLQEKYHISKIAIFGSVVKNALNEQSDIDILIEFDKSIGFFTLVHLQNELRSLLGRDVDLTTSGALHPLLRNTIMKELVYV
jgi:uncharacterized protein